MTYLRQLFMIIFAVIVLVCLQYQYWFGTNGRGDLAALNKQISEQQSINSDQQKANEQQNCHAQHSPKNCSETKRRFDRCEQVCTFFCRKT